MLHSRDRVHAYTALWQMICQVHYLAHNIVLAPHLQLCFSASQPSQDAVHIIPSGFLPTACLWPGAPEGVGDAVKPLLPSGLKPFHCCCRQNV
jgi:hypothetical protein